MKKFLIFISIFTIAHSLTFNYFLSGDRYDYFTRTVKFFVIQNKKVSYSDSGEEYRFICKKCDDGVLYSFPAYLEEYNSFPIGNKIGVEIKGSDLCKNKKYEDLRAYYF